MLEYCSAILIDQASDIFQIVNQIKRLGRIVNWPKSFFILRYIIITLITVVKLVN